MSEAVKEAAALLRVVGTVESVRAAERLEREWYNMKMVVMR
jgi:hypothetical protein